MAKKRNNRYIKREEDEQLLQDQQMLDAMATGEPQAVTEPQEVIPQIVIDKAAINKAGQTLEDYKKGKSSLDQRVISNEKWYKMRHWEEIRNGQDKNNPEPTSAWLLNSIINKHADAMDNFPEPSILPREINDEGEAETLSSIIPVILEQNQYEQVYSDKWWYKLKTGTGITGVFWNPQKNNGIGDIEIRKIDILNLFWQPGIADIQESRNVFHVKLVDNEELEESYPQLVGKLGAESGIVAKYVLDDAIDTSKKSCLVDWYYKRNGLLHYCQYVNDEVLYASENDEQYRERGFYDHGLYPFVFDTLFVEELTPCGFGYIDIMKDAQLYIDKLNQIIITNALMAGRKRWFTKNDGNVNEEEFADWSKTFVHVAGSLDDTHMREIVTNPLSDTYVNMLTHKIEELKETSGNRDFSQGGTTGGITAASAIAALQEAGSKTSRDMIKSSYRSFRQEVNLVIELIRQFYDEARSFRITGEDYKTSFVKYSNEGITPQSQGNDFGVDFGLRLPVFDISVKAHRSNPFSKVSQNEMAKEFYGLGFFNPQMADQALVCLEMMDFEGKQKIVQKVEENGTLYQMVMQLQQTIIPLAQIVDSQNGTNVTQSVMQQLQGITGQSVPSGVNAGSSVQTNPLGDAVKSSNNTTATSARERATNVSNPDK